MRKNRLLYTSAAIGGLFLIAAGCTPPDEVVIGGDLGQAGAAAETAAEQVNLQLPAADPAPTMEETAEVALPEDEATDPGADVVEQGTEDPDAEVSGATDEDPDATAPAAQDQPAAEQAPAAPASPAAPSPQPQPTPQPRGGGG